MFECFVLGFGSLWSVCITRIFSFISISIIILCLHKSCPCNLLCKWLIQFLCKHMSYFENPAVSFFAFVISLTFFDFNFKFHFVQFSFLVQTEFLNRRENTWDFSTLLRENTWDFSTLLLSNVRRCLFSCIIRSILLRCSFVLVFHSLCRNLFKFF
jgi:hypothetical protein